MRRKGKAGGGSNKPKGSSGKKSGMFNRPKSGSSPKSSSPFRTTSKGNPIALILGIFFAVAAIAAAIIATNPNIIPPIGGSISCTERNVTVNALSPGAAIPVKLSIGKNDSKAIMPVEFTEVSNNTGASLKSSANMAAVMSSFLLGEDLSACKFTVKPETDKDVDGPSAGALFTVGFISLLRGDKINPNLTMTGTINPDATVGLVGGIPGKLEAAENLRKNNLKDVDKITVLIPPQEDDEIRSVDTKLTNLDTQPVTDIFKAYERLTGKPMPRYNSKNISLDNLMLSQATNTELKREVDRLKENYAIIPAVTKTIPVNNLSLKQSLGEISRSTSSFYRQYETYQGLGQEGLSGAYNRLNAANFAGSIHQNMTQFVSLLEQDRISEINGFAFEKVISPSERKLQTLIENLEQKSKEDIPLSAFVDSYANTATAKSLISLAKKLPDQISAEAFIPWLLGKLVIPELSKSHINQAEISMVIGKSDKSSGSLSENNNNKLKLISVAKILGRAATANLKYLDTIIGKPNDISYYLASASESLSNELIRKLDDVSSEKIQIVDVYDLIGSAVSSYLTSSLLIHKYYSLDAETNELGLVNTSKLSIQKKEFVKTLSEKAGEEARAFIAILKDKNMGYQVPAFNFWQSQSMVKSGDISEQIESISGFWAASFEARIALMVAGVKPE